MSTRIFEGEFYSREGAKARRGRRSAATVGSDHSSSRLCAFARLSFLVAPLIVAACGQSSNQASESAADSGQIDCAPQGAAEFKRVCTLDRVEGADGLELIVHNPDGGFHRLLVTKDGRGVAAADGAETAKVTIVGAGTIEVAIGGDRYRLPATVKGAAPA